MGERDAAPEQYNGVCRRGFYVDGEQRDGLHSGMF